MIQGTLGILTIDKAIQNLVVSEKEMRLKRTSHFSNQTGKTEAVNCTFKAHLMMSSSNTERALSHMEVEAQESSAQDRLTPADNHQDPCLRCHQGGRVQVD